MAEGDERMTIEAIRAELRRAEADVQAELVPGGIYGEAFMRDFDMVSTFAVLYIHCYI